MTIAGPRQNERLIGAGGNAETAFRAGGEKPFLLYRTGGSEDRRICFLSVEGPGPDQAADGGSTDPFSRFDQELPPVFPFRNPHSAIRNCHYAL
jgi:hypothetical protein